MHEKELIDNGFYFTSKYMQIAFTNGKIDLVVTKRNGNYIYNSFLCDTNGFKLSDNVRTINDVLKFNTSRK